jgi:cytochrome c biogenesis protein CcdA
MIGILSSFLSSFIVNYLPIFTLLSGLLVFFMGITLVIGFKLPQFLPFGRAPQRKGVLGLFLYGILYGLATISCSAPIFFSILVYTISQGAGQTIVSFAAYALGMATPLIGITVVLAKTRNTIQQRVIAFTPKLQKLAGLILIIVGSYLIYYFLT